MSRPTTTEILLEYLDPTLQETCWEDSWRTNPTHAIAMLCDMVDELETQLRKIYEELDDSVMEIESLKDELAQARNEPASIRNR